MKQIFVEDKAILVHDTEITEVSQCTVYTDDDTIIIYPDNKDYETYKSKIIDSEYSIE